MFEGVPLNRIVVECLLAAAALYSFWHALKSWNAGRSIADTPTSKVRSAAQGYVSLAGRGTLPDGVENKSPLTRQPCAWWSYKIESRDDTSRSRNWSTEESGASTTIFFLDDGTGRCMVDPRGAEVVADEKTVWYGSTPRPEVRIPAANGMFGKTVDALFSGNYRYTEHRISLGAPVYAVGAFHSVGGVAATDLDAETSELLRTWKKDQAALLARFDGDGDGKISGQEWDAARDHARKEAQRHSLARKPDPVVNVMGAPQDGRAFVLASSDGAALSRRMRWRALGGVTGFLLALTALTLIHGAV